MALRSFVGRVFPSMIAGESSANVAKDRLQIILAKSRGDANPLAANIDMNAMQEDLLAVVRVRFTLGIVFWGEGGVGREGMRLGVECV